MDTTAGLKTLGKAESNANTQQDTTITSSGEDNNVTAPGTSGMSATAPLTQMELNQMDLNQIVLKYLNKKGYKKTEQMLLKESQGVPPDPKQPKRLLADHFEFHVNRAPLSQTVREDLQVIEDGLHKLLHFFEWSDIATGLISYIMTHALKTIGLSRYGLYDAFGVPHELMIPHTGDLLPEDIPPSLPPPLPVDGLDKPLSEDQEVLPESSTPEVPVRSRKRSRASSVGSMASGRSRSGRRKGDDEAGKIYFCFHDSCSQDYANAKSLETHVERSHKDRWPELPGTCDHDGSIKTFRTWDASLSHLIHHQKVLRMTRKDYDRIHHAASFWLDYNDRQIDRAASTPFNKSPGHFASAPNVFDSEMPGVSWDTNQMLFSEQNSDFEM